MVPPELQAAVWRHYRPGQCDDMRPSPEWHAAADAAIKSVAEQEAPRAVPTPIALAAPTGRLLWIDTETTGATTSYRHQIIEIAVAATERDGTMIDEPRSVLIALEPWSTQDLRSIAVHGIDWRKSEFQAKAKPLRAVLERVLARLPGHTIAGHNVQFDIGFISDHCERLKLSQPAELAAKPLCTLAMARRLKKQGLLRIDSCSLTSLRDVFGVGHAAHRAASDLAANIEIYRAMLALESQPLLKTGTQ
jgi:DNA polymerase III epsilon subunit-like protein